MSKDTRFKKGKSGNPKGRPRKPNADQWVYDAILEKRLTGTIDGVVEELTPEEAVEQRILKDAFAGKAMAIRKILKMIEEWQSALSTRKSRDRPVLPDIERFSSDSANEALQILEIAAPHKDMPEVRWNISRWAVQAALSRPGRCKYTASQRQNIELFTCDGETLHWPAGRIDDD
ncbi:MAG: DUF5681 domain-containing protein [Pseudomonadota bacterium]